jgi:hypothetical protein
VITLAAQPAKKGAFEQLIWPCLSGTMRRNRGSWGPTRRT